MSILSLLAKPVTDIVTKKQEIKAAKNAAQAALSQAQLEQQGQVTMKDQDLEKVLANQKESSWTDEYATVSILSMLNLLVVGGISAAFGEPRVMEGVVLAIRALSEVGVDIGFLMETVTLAAVGLTVWRKVT